MAPRDARHESEVIPLDMIHRARREADHAFNAAAATREDMVDVKNRLSSLETKVTGNSQSIDQNSEAIGKLTREVARLATAIEGEKTLAARISQLHLDEEDTALRERRELVRRRFVQWKIFRKVVFWLFGGGGAVALGALLSRCSQ